jgi:hypothetical protein
LITTASIEKSAFDAEVKVDLLKMMILLVEDSRFLRLASAEERARVKAGYDVVSVGGTEKPPR